MINSHHARSDKMKANPRAQGINATQGTKSTHRIQGTQGNIGSQSVFSLVMRIRQCLERFAPFRGKFFRFPFLIYWLYPPGQNKRNILFSRLLFFSSIVWSHICTIYTSLITQLILKVSALSNEKWSRKMQMYSMYSYTIVPKKANFGKIVLLSTIFLKQNMYSESASNSE
jgi:hypothetical protein